MSMNANDFLNGLFTTMPTTAVIVPTRENQNSPEARRRAPMVPIESEVIEHNATSNATPANPFPCVGCGSAVFWLSAAGATTCPGCDPKPVDALHKLIIATLPDGRTEWEPLSDCARQCALYVDNLPKGEQV